MTSSSEEEEKNRRARLAQCLLGQYRYCAGGVIVGAGYSVLARSSTRPVGPWPMLAGGFAGTLGDFAYGYFVECAHLRADGRDGGGEGRGGGGTASKRWYPLEERWWSYWNDWPRPPLDSRKASFCREMRARTPIERHSFTKQTDIIR